MFIVYFIILFSFVTHNSLFGLVFSITLFGFITHVITIYLPEPNLEQIGVCLLKY